MGLQQQIQYSPIRSSQRCLRLPAMSCLFLTLLLNTGYLTPAMAIPSGDYRFDLPSVLVGTFTSDGTKITAWDFTSPDFGTGVGPITWNSADLSSVKSSDGLGIYQEIGLSNLTISLSPFGNADQGGGANIFVTVPCPVVEQCGGPTSTNGSIHIPWIPVPEATTTLLLALGVISLAGFQWWLHPLGQIQMN